MSTKTAIDTNQEDNRGNEKLRKKARTFLSTWYADYGIDFCSEATGIDKVYLKGQVARMGLKMTVEGRRRIRSESAKRAAMTYKKKNSLRKKVYQKKGKGKGRKFSNTEHVGVRHPDLLDEIECLALFFPWGDYDRELHEKCPTR